MQNCSVLATAIDQSNTRMYAMPATKKKMAMTPVATVLRVRIMRQYRAKNGLI
jgi:hypothetical protein